MKQWACGIGALQLWSLNSDITISDDREHERRIGFLCRCFLLHDASPTVYMSISHRHGNLRLCRGRLANLSSLHESEAIGRHATERKVELVHGCVRPTFRSSLTQNAAPSRTELILNLV